MKKIILLLSFVLLVSCNNSVTQNNADTVNDSVVEGVNSGLNQEGTNDEKKGVVLENIESAIPEHTISDNSIISIPSNISAEITESVEVSDFE